MKRALWGIVLVILATDAAIACDQAENLVGTACDFNEPADVVLWNVEGGDCTHAADEGAVPGSGPGSMECDAEVNQDSYIGFRHCIAGGDSETTYGFGGKLSLVSGSILFCSFQLDSYEEAGCSGPLSGSPNSFGADAAGAPSFAASPTGSHTTGTTVGSIQLAIDCFADADFVIRFDDAYVGVGLVPVELQNFTVD